VVLGLDEHMASVFVDYELAFNAESLQAVPEFLGLRRGHSLSRSPMPSA
jgi:hypothetical protein